MTHRSKLMIAFLAAAMLLSSPLLATTARIQALGGSGDYFEDEANTTRWYGSLGDYPNLVVLESGHFSLQEGYHGDNGDLLSGPGLGIHRSWGRWGTTALYFNGRDANADPGGLVPSDLENTFTALIGGSYRAVQGALMIRRGSYSEDWSKADQLHFLPETISRNNSRLDVGAGLRVDVTENAYLDLAGEFRQSEFDESWRTPFDSTFDEVRRSSGTFGLRSRGFIRVSENSAVVPQVELLVADAPMPISEMGLIPSVEGHQIRTGCGWNYFPDPDKMLLVSFEYLYGEGDLRGIQQVSEPFEHQWALKWDSYDVTLGGETRFLAWMTLRASYGYAYRSRSELLTSPPGVLTDTEPTENSGVTQCANLGLGVHLGRYDLDVALRSDFPSGAGDYMGQAFFLESQEWLSITFRARF